MDQPDSEILHFDKCTNVPTWPIFKQMVKWWRSSFERFEWDKFCQHMPHAWLGVWTIEKKTPDGKRTYQECVARARLNLGVPATIPLNTAEPGYNPKLCLYLTAVYVQPEYRRQGYAQKLINGMLQKLRELGCSAETPVYLEIDVKNDAAHKLYTKMGWRTTPSAYKTWNGKKATWYALVRSLGSSELNFVDNSVTQNLQEVSARLPDTPYTPPKD